MTVSKKRSLLLSSAIFCVLTLASCGQATKPAPVTQLGTRVDSVNGAVMVQRGDTVSSVANRYKLPLRDIIDLNGLTPPYHLATGQRLLLPPPNIYRVGASDTLFRVARMYKVPVSQLVKTNGLKSPYRLNVGQVLRIPASRGASSAPVQIAQHQTSAPRMVSGGIEKVESVDLSPPTSAQAAPSRAVQKEAEVVRTQTTVMHSKADGFIWPVRGRVISSYGPKDGGLHNDGINIAAPKGTPVMAAGDGVVTYVGTGIRSYGNLVLIRHGDGMVTAYAHLSSVSVSKGMRVGKGQAIGSVGSTGTVANTQLHFEVRRGTETLDPQKFLG